MRTVRSIRLALVFISLAMSAASAASGGLLGLTPAQVRARLGSSGRLYGTYRAIGQPVNLYCVAGTYKPSYYDPYTGKWVNESAIRRMPGDTYGPCAQHDRAHPETVLVRYDRGRVIESGYVTAFGSARDEGWLAALDRILVGFDPRLARPTELASPEISDIFPRLVSAWRFEHRGTMIIFEPAIGSMAFLWCAPGVCVEPSKTFLRRDPIVAVIVRLDFTFHMR